MPMTTQTPKPTAAATPIPLATQAPKPAAAETPMPLTTLAPKPAAAETPMPLATLAPKPAAAETPKPAATPAALAAAQSNAPIVLKQPNGEGHYIGESAVFIVDARHYTSLYWNAVSPSGREIDMKTFREVFPDCTVFGEKDTTLTITNLNIDMSGWSFFCTFTNEDASTPTEEARLKVTAVAGATTNANGEKVNNRILRCPYCGGGIWDDKIEAYVYQDQSGSIFYIDPTGTMFYDARSRSTTFEDHNSNYAVFDANGKPKFGNYEKEQQDLEDHALLVALGLYP